MRSDGRTHHMSPLWPIIVKTLVVCPLGVASPWPPFLLWVGEWGKGGGSRTTQFGSWAINLQGMCALLMLW